ncbi:hypothetical protein [Plantactinospora sp. CA-290183]|uniref:hypothetical protein n=1 Tax=Plantactinospora sp. CA-290183 TaxID=3240006 RepID=UPI003D94B867
MIQPIYGCDAHDQTYLFSGEEADEWFDEQVAAIQADGGVGRTLRIGPLDAPEMRVDIDIVAGRAALWWLPDGTYAVKLPPGRPIVVVRHADSGLVTIPPGLARVSVPTARAAVVAYADTGRKPSGLTWTPSEPAGQTRTARALRQGDLLARAEVARRRAVAAIASIDAGLDAVDGSRGGGICSHLCTVSEHLGIVIQTLSRRGRVGTDLVRIAPLLVPPLLGNWAKRPTFPGSVAMVLAATAVSYGVDRYLSYRYDARLAAVPAVEPYTGQYPQGCIGWVKDQIRAGARHIAAALDLTSQLHTVLPVPTSDTPQSPPCGTRLRLIAHHVDVAHRHLSTAGVNVRQLSLYAESL